MARPGTISRFVILLAFFAAPLLVVADELLPADTAFRLSVEKESADSIVLGWQIAEGYYLYRNKFAFQSTTEGVRTENPEIPRGKTKHDDYFGDVEVHREKIEIVLPVAFQKSTPAEFGIVATYQGCADIGVCYPPIRKELTLNNRQVIRLNGAGLSANPASALQKFVFGSSQSELLPAKQAFRFFARVRDANTLHVNWEIAQGYYLYREKFRFELAQNSGVALSKFDLPRGTPEHDEAFGNVEIFHDAVGFDLPIQRTTSGPRTIELIAHFQGCADQGVCYPPMKNAVLLDLPSATDTIEPTADLPRRSESEQIAFSLQRDSFGLTVLSFFGFGLLLAFTPCVFPMIPILSGIIVGQGESIETRRAFLLSFCYVLASAVTYTVFGVIAALFGSSLNLQAMFQAPAIIIAFSSLFVLLAFSMFGFFTLQMPSAIQTRISTMSQQGRQGGGALAAATMGVLSALIVGPCVAAPLAGALIYIGQTGDAVLGGLALFAMGMGMGFPLLIIGTSAGRLLPKVGPWMNSIKAVFGVLLLAVAVWLLDRIVPSAISMLLWAALLIIPAIYLRAIDGLPESASGWTRLWKGCGIIMLITGVLLIIGVASGNRDPLRPLANMVAGGTTIEKESLTFKPVVSSQNLDLYLEKAAENGQWVMLDYYADWCISCKEMDYYTFSDPVVRKALDKLVLVQADVTDDTPVNNGLLQRFNLIGPPAILFFQPGKGERREFRVVGYKDPEPFLQHLRQFLTDV